MAGDDLTVKAAEAISKSQYKWRTAQSIARELNVNANTAFEVLAGSDTFVRAKKPNARGQPLFTTSKKYREQTPFLKRLFGAAANTVID